MYPKDDIQLRVYMDTGLNIITGDSTQSGVPAPGTITANLLAKVSRLQTHHIQAVSKTHTKPNHYRFTETRFGTFSVTSSSLNTTIVLTPIVGTVAYFFFVVRNVSELGGEGQFKYNPINYWALLDASSTNIVGGQAITSDYNLTYLSKDWIHSSYLSEIGVDDGVNIGDSQYPNNNAYVYFYSFSADPTETAKTGVGYNHHTFVGNEQLQIQFTSAPVGTVQIDLYAAVESVVESTQTYVKKISL